MFFSSEVEEVLSWEGVSLNIKKGSKAVKQVARVLQEATIHAQESIQSRNEGKVVDTPADTLSGLSESLSGQGSLLLSQAIEEWVEDKSRTSWASKTREAHEGWARQLIAALGDKPVVQYTKADAREFRQLLLQLPPAWERKVELKGLDIAAASERADMLGMQPMSLKTARKVIGFVSSLWSWMVDNYDLDKNIFQGIKIKVKSKPQDARMPFTIEELKSIFAAPLYTGALAKNRPHDKGDYLDRASARYWSPLIGLYSGMRLNEILQLHVTDIREEGGIHYFSVNSEDGKSLKTHSSHRSIPIHERLLDAGLLEFVQGCTTKRLFPELKANKHGSYSDPVTHFFSELLRRQGIKHDKIAFHSFRHTFEDGCRNNGVTKEVMDALQGHAEQGMSGRYGAGFELKVLNEGVQKVDYGLGMLGV